MDYESFKSWRENLLIYKENLSVYYVLSIFISFLSVFLTWWYHRYNLRQSSRETQSVSMEPGDGVKEKCDKDFGEPMDLEKLPSKELLKQVKLVKQSQNVADIISAGLTEEQLKEEKEVEGQQLTEIFKVLQKQNDKFNINSIEELKDQMKLYRP